MMPQILVILYFLSDRGDVTQCKWRHSDSGSQNLDRPTVLLVYGSFKIKQEFQDTLNHRSQKAASPQSSL